MTTKPKARKFRIRRASPLAEAVSALREGHDVDDQDDLDEAEDVTHVMVWFTQAAPSGVVAVSEMAVRGT